MKQASGYRVPTAERPSGSTLNIKDRLRNKIKNKIFSNENNTNNTTSFPASKDGARPAVWLRNANNKNSTNIYVLDRTDVSNYMADEVDFTKCNLEIMSYPVPAPLLINTPTTVECAQAGPVRFFNAVSIQMLQKKLLFKIAWQMR